VQHLVEKRIKEGVEKYDDYLEANCYEAITGR